MTIKQLLEDAIIKLQAITDSAWLEAHILLGYVLEKERIYLIAHDDENIQDEKIEEYINIINLRLTGTPIQHITGEKEFMSLKFRVNSSVLIPRPETELLVEELISFTAELKEKKEIRIADIGTGSGCIAVSIAAFIKNSHVTAVDISKDALNTAKINAEEIGVRDRIEFIESDLFANLTDKKFDIIVSNPPYIPKEMIKSLQIEVRDYEPVLALDGGVDGLDYYRRIIKASSDYLNPNGLIAFEVGHNQAYDVMNIIQKNKKFKSIKIIKDYSEKERIVTAVYGK